MSEENEYLRGETRRFEYGAIVPESPLEDEVTPLLEEMDDPKIGISTLTLVSVTTANPIPRRLMQYVAAFSVTLGAFALGNVLSWTSPTKDILEDAEHGFGFSGEQSSWIGASMALGAAVVVLPCGWLLDHIGRKKTMLLLVLPFVAGWLLIVFADDLAMFITGRFITGMMGGAFSLTAPTYTSEIADDRVRGLLGSLFQLMVTVGILFVYILGCFDISLVALSIVCAVVPLIFGSIFIFMPETPFYLLKKGQEAEARTALQWFRGSFYNIDPEIQTQKETLEKIEREKVSFLEAFSSKSALKALFIASGLMFFQQLSGVNAVIFYVSDIFKASGSTLEPKYSAVIVGVVQAVSTLVSALIVDYLGRRLLLLISDSIMAVCCVLLGVFFYFQEADVDASIGWLPLVSLCVFMVVFSLGYGPIPWLMIGELFPPNIKGIASSISCMVNWGLAFLVTKFYPTLSESLGQYVTFWIFAGVCVVGTFFVLIFVPETKGKSLQEIQRELGGGDNSEIPVGSGMGKV